MAVYHAGAGINDDMEAEDHGPKIIGLRAKGSNGIYTSRPSFSLKSDLNVYTFWYVKMPNVTSNYRGFFDLIAFYGIFFNFIKLLQILC